MSSVDPKILAKMQKETAFLQSQQRGARRIKLLKGHNIKVRFLPAKLGPDKMWYARIARHWLNKVPITCPKLTGEDFGGDTQFDCPVCNLADELNDDRQDKDVSDLGYSIRSNPGYLTYCVLWEKDGVREPMEEVMNPYEFLLNKSSWEELRGFYEASSHKAADSVLDYRKGNDFSINRTSKGTRLDKLDVESIFDEDDPNFEKYIKKLEAALKAPRVQIPTPAQLEAFADKVQGEVVRSHRHRDDDDRPRSRRDDDERPRSRRDDDERPRSSRDDEERPRSRRDEDEERPRSRSTDADAAPRRRTDDEEAPRKRREPEEEAPRSRREPDEEAPRGRREPEEAPRKRRDEEEERPRSRRDEEDEPKARGNGNGKTKEEDDLPYDSTPRRGKAENDDDRPRSRRTEDEEAPRGRRESEEEAPRKRRDEEEEAPRKRREPEAARDEEPDPPRGAEEPDPHEEEAPRPRGKLEETANRTRLREGNAKTDAEDPDDNLPEEAKDAAPAADKLPARGKTEEAEEPPPVERKGKTAEAIHSRISKLKGRE